MVSPIDPDEVRPSAHHLALLAVAVPKPRDALLSFSRESGLALTDIALWVLDLRSTLGAYVWTAAMDDEAGREAFIGSAARRGVPPVLATATSLQGALMVMGEMLPDLLVHVQSRPVGTVTVVIADQDDDIRLSFMLPDDLDREH